MNRIYRVVFVLVLWIGCSAWTSGSEDTKSVIVAPLFPEQQPENLKTIQTRGTVYVCKIVGGNEGLCTDTESTCVNQGGTTTGHCFYNYTYEGVCCSGLRPNALLAKEAPTVPPAPTIPTSAAQDWPGFPTFGY
ncbi:unnamed protein product [Allacma fusca]|uniref:Uncharacterized protein n=1 Tax=Allacma fusca TaxID=39272 RepID=A0A8J2LAU4_9HEXA|nr:unnamed protein product [Allacma fusca]